MSKKKRPNSLSRDEITATKINRDDEPPIKKVTHFSTDVEKFYPHPDQELIDRSSSGGYSKKQVTIRGNKPRPVEERDDTTMIVPYISTKTFPDYWRMMIESYDWMPQEVHYVMNDVREPLWKQKFDFKACEIYRACRPKKYFVLHASDIVLMPQDLARMHKIMEDDPKCFAVGIYPIGAGMAHNKLFQNFNMPTRICIWRSDVIEQVLESGVKAAKKCFKGVPLDCWSFMAVHAHKLGYRARIDPKSRPFHIEPGQFKTMWINPTV